MSKAIGNFAALLFVCCSVLHAQIWDGGWFSSTGAGFGTSCTDDRVDAEAICEVHAYCTEPPDPIPGFVIAGSGQQYLPKFSQLTTTLRLVKQTVSPSTSTLTPLLLDSIIELFSLRYEKVTATGETS